MTASTIALTELAEKGAGVDVLRQMVQFMAQRLMEIDVEGRCGAGYDEKSAERTNSRNGFRRPYLGDARRRGRTQDPQAAPGQLLPRVPGASQDGREGADSHHPGGLHQGHLHALCGRPGQGDGHERRLQEPSLAPVRRTRRAGRRLPQPHARRRLAIPLD